MIWECLHFFVIINQRLVEVRRGAGGFTGTALVYDTPSIHDPPRHTHTRTNEAHTACIPSDGDHAPKVRGGQEGKGDGHHLLAETAPILCEVEHRRQHTGHGIESKGMFRQGNLKSRLHHNTERNQGLQPGKTRGGLVEENQPIPKQAFFFWGGDTTGRIHMFTLWW